MTTVVVTCECGAQVRLPTEATERALRCPRCKSLLKAPVRPEPVPQEVVSSQPMDAGVSVICPICQSTVGALEQVVTCEACDQTHHAECWSEIGGCGTYGCSKAPAIDDPEKSAGTPLSAWGDTKKCPACGETIKAIALRCRYCQTDFGSVNPLSVADLRRRARSQDRTDSSKKSVVALFVASIVGCLAPLMLIIGLVYMLRHREHLAKCGPLFVIIGWASVGLSGLYTLLMLGFVLAEL